jgi:hypothetical protein
VEVINVRGQLTLEDTCVQYTIYKEDFEALSRNAPRDTAEFTHYRSLMDALETEVEKAGGTENNSRQLRVVHEATDGWPCCISVVQLLAGNRNPRQLVCYWRSSSADFLRSDLGFLAEVALRYDCDEIVCFAASFHVELMKHPDPPVTTNVVQARPCSKCGTMILLNTGSVHLCTA